MCRLMYDWDTTYPEVPSLEDYDRFVEEAKRYRAARGWFVFEDDPDVDPETEEYPEPETEEYA